jgi:hypothetical protein
MFREEGLVPIIFRHKVGSTQQWKEFGYMLLLRFIYLVIYFWHNNVDRFLVYESKNSNALSWRNCGKPLKTRQITIFSIEIVKGILSYRSQLRPSISFVVFHCVEKAESIMLRDPQSHVVDCEQNILLHLGIVRSNLRRQSVCYQHQQQGWSLSGSMIPIMKLFCFFVRRTW